MKTSRMLKSRKPSARGNGDSVTLALAVDVLRHGRGAILLMSLALMAGCTSKVSAPDLGASVTQSPSVMASVVATTGLPGCDGLASDDDKRDSWRGLQFQCLADGHSVRGNQLRGTPTIVVVWASWCGPCREELPLFAQFATEQKRVRVIGIGWRDDPVALQNFARRTSLPFPSLVDRESAIAAAWNIHGQPAAVFLSAQGIVTHIERSRIPTIEQLRTLAQQHVQ